MPPLNVTRGEVDEAIVRLRAALVEALGSRGSTGDAEDGP
jgi:hypothetical protein